MTREIKFRAWNYETQKMLSWVSLAPRIYELYGQDKNGDASSLEFMQFTGLHDKNGKEVFEGDILTGGGSVEWLGDGWKTRVMTPKGIRYYGMFRNEEIITKSIRKEIIGNIYENPELLK